MTFMLTSVCSRSPKFGFDLQNMAPVSLTVELQNLKLKFVYSWSVRFKMEFS